MVGIGEPLTVSSPSADGAIYDYGAQAVSWIPRGGSEVLYLSSTATLSPGTAIRGGIPVCFPWFGAGRTGDRAPAHGFARTRVWARTAVHTDDNGTVVEHELTGPTPSPPFPHAFRAILRTRFAARFQTSLTIANTGTSPFSYEAALHTYLRVGDVGRIRIDGLEEVAYRDKTAEGATFLQQGPIVPSAETDRVYLSPGPVVVVDPVLERTVTVTTTGSAETVVWNPWSTGSARLSDVGPDEWRTFICVEGANVLGSAIHLDPGTSHTMEYALAVSG